MLEYTRNLGFEETPNYEYLHKLIFKMLQDRQLSNDNNFDWMGKANISTPYNDSTTPKEASTHIYKV